MPAKPSQPDPLSGGERSAKMPRMISSRELLGNDRVVIIRHDTDEYRLQLTAAGKLILTK
jgi:hemin uptake protein HemP